MKKLLAVLAGMVFVLAVGATYAADVTTDRHYNLDQYPDVDRNQGLINQMPSGTTGAGGSAAGGRGDLDANGKDSTAVQPDPYPPLEKNFSEPYDGGNSHGKDDPYKSMEKFDQDTYRY